MADRVKLLKEIKKASIELSEKCESLFLEFEKSDLSKLSSDLFTEQEIEIVMGKLDLQSLFLGTPIHVRVYQKLMGKKCWIK